MIEFIFASILFLLGIYVSFKLAGVISQGIGDVLAPSEQEMRDIETAIRGESRKKLMSFATGEIFIFIPIWIFLLFYMVIAFPELLLQYLYPDIELYFASGYSVIMGISGFMLSAMGSAYIASFMVRIIYKVFHPTKNSMIMFYNSFQLYNPKDPDDDKLYYQSRDFIFGTGIFTILLYIFCLTLSYVGVNVITSTHYYDNNPILYMSTDYIHDQLEYSLESKEYSDGIDYRFIVQYDNTVIASNRLADESGSKAMEQRAEKLRNLLGEQLIEVKK